MRLFCVIVLLTVSPVSAEPTIHRDISYTDSLNGRHWLDLYVPATGKAHEIVFWTSDDSVKADSEADVRFKPDAFVDEGFIFVAVNFPLAAKSTIKERASSVAAAIRWVCNHAKDYEGDPDNIFVAGTLGAAQLAALVCTDPSYFATEALSMTIVKGCVAVDGDAYGVPIQVMANRLKNGKLEKRFQSDDDPAQAATVAKFLKDEYIPPFLIMELAKTRAGTVEAKRFHEVLKEARVNAKLLHGVGESDGRFISDEGPPFNEGFPLNEHTYHLFGFLEGVIRPRNLELFRAKLDKTVTPKIAEQRFGTPNAEFGSGVLHFRYKLADGTDIYLTFQDRKNRIWHSGVLSKATHGKNNQTFETLPLK